MQRKWRRDWERGRSNKKDGKRNPLNILARSFLPSVAAAGILLGSVSGAYANPTGGQVTTGSGAISEKGTTMTINQTSNKLGINWQSFSIGTGETVQFIQPGSTSVALNRVIGNDASSIYGSLISNGKVFLINPNGILFAPGCSVNVGGIVASSLNISDEDFRNGNYKFSQDGSAGSVVNQGTITAQDYAVLLGPRVKNEGVIAARVSSLAAGNAVSLDFDGDNLLNVTVDTAAAGGMAVNSGQILADGGLVIMSAGTREALLDTVVNNSGNIQAASVNNVNGVILLEADNVTVSGTLNASGKTTGQTGGTVKVLGNTVTLADGAKVDVSGDAGGGTALIGGNYQGKGTERNAATTTVAQNATVNADAISGGDGGKVVVWADDTTGFNGSISAKGGATGGDGGQVEVSGKKSLVYKGHTDTTAALGKTGSLLLDPGEYTISADATGGNIKNAAELGNELAFNNITLQTDGSGTGNITVEAPVTWSAGTTLSLIANNNIDINANITASGSGAGLALTTATGGYNLGDGAEVTLSGSGATFSLNGTAYTVINDYSAGGALQALQNMNTNLTGKYFLGVDVDASATSGWNSGAGWTPIGSATSSATRFKGIFDGGGHVISGLTINDSSNVLNKSIGLFGGTSSSTIRNVGLEDVNITYNGSNNAYVGSLVGRNGTASTIDNCYSTGTITFQSTTTSNSFVGGLVANGQGDQISNSYSAVTINATNVNAASMFGGFLGSGGYGGTRITNCYSTGAVNVTTASGFTGALKVGGFAGAFYNSANALLQNSYSSGAVNVTFQSTPIGTSVTTRPAIGGLVGYNYSTGTIQNCYSTSEVTANVSNAYVGALVGVGNNISNSYSTGKINNNGSGNIVGGVAGYGVAGKITGSYWDTQTSGVSEGVGNISGYSGVTGLTTAQMMDQAYLRDTLGWDFTNTWYMIDGYTRPFLQMEYSTNITNAHQLQLMAMHPDAAYTLGACFDAGDAFADASGMWLTQNTASLAGKTSYGFVPVGDSADPFTGTFTGNGNIISGLRISNSGAYAGLFGYVRNAVISNVGLTSATVGGGSGTAVGALAGYNEGGTISGVFSSGTVNGGTHTGGLVGYNAGAIADSYSISTVSGSGNSGGLVGYNTGTITDAYSSGAVSGGTAGGLVGVNDGTVSGSVWHKSGSGQNSGVGGGSGTADVTEMSSDGSYPAGWSSAVWQAGLTRPVLRWQLTNGYITTVDQLLLVSLNLSGKYKLGDNLDLTGLAWTPIGTDAAAAFTGTLLGNGYTISGLTINSAATYLGLFGYTQGATISGVNLAGVSITGTGTASQYIGGLVGYSGTGTTITGCSGAGTVTASGAASYVGGLVGENTGSIQGSANTATVSANGAGSYAGGVAGRNYTGGSIADSYNAGAVTAGGTGSYAGGLAGVNDGSITGTAYNAATVTARGANNVAGGLIGLNNGSLTSLYNTGTVASEADGSVIGGLVGENNGTINDCYSDATVETASGATNNIVGGLVGLNDGSRTITGSYAAGLVSAQGAGSTVGGLAGKNAGNVNNSYSMTVTRSTGAGGTVGGLVGENTGTINNVFSVGAVTGTGDVGGLAGVNSGTITNAMWATDTSGQANGVGSGGNTGVQGLTFADMRRSASYDGTWSTSTWGIIDDFLPYLKWQYSTAPTLTYTGIVEDGAGQRVNAVYGGTQIGRGHVIGADGFYYGVGTATIPAGAAPTLLLYVAGDPNYKANSIYCGSSGSTSFTNGYLRKDTLILDVSNLGSIATPLGGGTQTFSSPDLIFAYNEQTGLTVYGDLQATNLSIKNTVTSSYGITTVASGSARGSVTITNAGDFWINDNGATASAANGYQYNMGGLGNQFISATGDITIQAGGNIVLRHGATNYTLLSAGGDITLVAGTGFVNSSGPTALSAGGRWLVYAPDQLIYSPNRTLYYYATYYATKIGTIIDTGSASDELTHDARGGLTGDFTLWGTAYGQTVPATGNGFIYTAANPALRPLTPAQLERREAVNAVQSGNNPPGHDQGEPVRRLETATLPAQTPPGATENLPFITIVDEGLALE